MWSFLSEGAHSEATRRRGQVLADGGLSTAPRPTRPAASSSGKDYNHVCRVRGSQEERGARTRTRRGVQAGLSNARFPGPASTPHSQALAKAATFSRVRSDEVASSIHGGAGGGVAAISILAGIHKRVVAAQGSIQAPRALVPDARRWSERRSPRLIVDGMSP